MARRCLGLVVLMLALAGATGCKTKKGSECKDCCTPCCGPVLIDGGCCGTPVSGGGHHGGGGGCGCGGGY